MNTKTKKSKLEEEKKLFLGDGEFSEEELPKLIEQKKEGSDAPLTDMIYNTEQIQEKFTVDALPHPTGVIQGETDPLQRFINMYQPGELVMRNQFREHLFLILENWRKK